MAPGATGGSEGAEGEEALPTAAGEADASGRHLEQDLSAERDGPCEPPAEHEPGQGLWHPGG